MTSSTDIVYASDIREGDSFLHNGSPVWTAIHDARETRDVDGVAVVAVDVQHHPDGGLDTRWYPIGHTWGAGQVRRKGAKAKAS